MTYLHTAILVLTLSGLTAPAAWAGPREDTLAFLDAAVGSNPIGLEVWVNGGQQTRFTIGEPLVFHFRALEDAYLTVLYVDSQGGTMILYPTSDPLDARLQAGQSLHFPPDGAVVTASEPAGHETVFALATRTPVALREVTSVRGSASPVVVEAEAAPALARRIAAIARARGADAALVRFDHEIVGRTQYTVASLVRTFTVKTRALRKPKVDLGIGFEFNSATLTAQAQRELDVVGQALVNDRLSSARFLLAGHTDDIGSAQYNRVLSQRRAEAARSFILARYPVAPERLLATGHGEARPLVAPVSEAARARNRRVVLEMVH